MARIRPDGTPPKNRAETYVMPRDTRRVVWWSLGGAAGILVLLIAGYAAGERRTLSPGTLASHHTRVDLKCAQCHDAGDRVAALRCERCHDPSGSDRLAHSAHVLLGSGDIRKAEAAEETACVSCHTEHRGPSFAIAAVDDRECATCHQFSSLARHPEFAVVRAGATPSVGLSFDHIGHLAKVKEARGVVCEACHEQTPDRRGFQPMSFDRHCGGSVCHTPNGALQRSTGVMAQELLLMPDQLPAEFRSAKPPAINQTRPGRFKAEQIVHRDPWIVANALRLRRSVDLDADSAERLALKTNISYLEQLQRPQPLHRLPPPQIEAGVQSLRAEIAEIDARLAQPVAPDADALTDIARATSALAGRLRVVDTPLEGDFGALAGATVQMPAPQKPGSRADLTVRFERRKAELLKILDTIEKRTDQQAFKDRAAALRRQVEGLTAPSAESDTDNAALVGRLTSLDDTLAIIRAIPDPGLQAEIDRVDLSRRYAVQRIVAGLGPDEFEARRAELLSLLDVIEQRGNDTLRYKVAALRQRVIALRPGVGNAELVRTRDRRQKELDRLLLEWELQNSTYDREDPPSQDASIDLKAVDRKLARLRADLRLLERAPRMNLATTAEERDARLNTLRALLEPCEKCHQYDASGVRMAPVRIAEPVMVRSVFNHAPHTTQTACVTCHKSVETSKLSTDVNVPGVATCQSCHGQSRARADCETCHVYHPRSPVDLVRVFP